MKITQVNTYTSFKRTNNANPGFKYNTVQPETNGYKQSNMLYDTNYSKLLINKPVTTPLSFKGAEKIPKIMADTISKIPFEERLASLVEILDKDTVILVSESKKTLHKLLKGTEGLFPDVIRKAFFLPEPSIKEGFGLMRTDIGPAIMNLGNKPFTVSHPDKPTAILPKGAAYWTMEGNKVSFDHFSFSVKEHSEKNMSMIRQNFSEPFDKSQDVQKVINNINKKTLEEFLVEKNVQKAMTFDEIGGLDTQIETLKRNFLYPIKYPFMYKNRDINIGAILYGPAGTGKTMLAKTLANESGCYYREVQAGGLSGGLVGQTEANWGALMQDLIDNQPSICLIDECSSVFKKRGGWDVHGDDAQEYILAQISNIEKNGDKVFFIGTTNRPESLDSAILRAGRFGIQMEIPNPDVKGLKQILTKKLKDFNIADDFKENDFAQALYEKNLNGSDINQILNNASDFAMERLGLFKQMENGLIKESAQNYKLVSEDFYKALNRHVEQNINASGKNKRNPIGFNAVNKPVDIPSSQLVAQAQTKHFG